MPIPDQEPHRNAKCAYLCATISASLAQHISQEQLEGALKGLSPTMKVKFRSAHDAYAGNEGQGLQQAGQVVEAMVKSMGAQAERAGIISHAAATGHVADLIDALYATNEFKDHRAALGAARDFVKEFRNVASHPSNSARNLAEKIRKCKAGFLDAINVAIKLRIVAQKMGYRLQIRAA